MHELCLLNNRKYGTKLELERLGLGISSEWFFWYISS